MFELEEVREEVQELDDQISEFCNKRSVLQSTERRLIADKILTDNLLKGMWELCLEKNGSHFNLVAREFDFPKLVRILDFWEDGYCYGIVLRDEVELHYTDGNLTIRFGDYSPKVVMDFIHDYNIVVAVEFVSKHLEELQERVLTIEKICNQFKT